jgi:hypothetical protein
MIVLEVTAMPRRPEVVVPYKGNVHKVLQTKVPANIRQRFDDLSDLSGLSAPEILRHCIHRALDEVEAQIRSGDIPPEPYLVKDLTTKVRRPTPVPLRTEIGAPLSLLSLIEHGIFPDGYVEEEPPEWARPAEEPVVEELPATPEIAEEPSPRPRRRRRG